MPFTAEKVHQYLNTFNFRELFVEELGWGNPTDHARRTLQVNDAYTRQQIAQLSGVVVLEITAADGRIPDAQTCRAIQTEIAKLYHENLLIFLDAHRTQSLWYWVKREAGKQYPREHHYFKNQPADLFLSKLSAMVVDLSALDEDGRLPVTEAARRLRDALDVERVTKKFYAEFAAQHVAFLEHIQGIDDEHDRRWYASVLLNRLMFIYFLQSKGFVGSYAADAENRKYLQLKLAESKAEAGSYYRDFLHALFFAGFAKPENGRTAEQKRLLGRVPYLNGGLFLPHPIEERWADIQVADIAFANLFGLFGRYSWNLDDTPNGQANEMRPEVLGYIFEKYINQKAFGAYYTRTEITQYLCEQTIYKLILDRVNSLAVPPKALPRYDSMADLLLNLDKQLCRVLFEDVLPDLKLLDPACGSGAFLVAAMKTLINIYAAVIGKMEMLGGAGRQRLDRLRREHPTLNYYIKKRIITDNLFGVDLMEEATEIAKLRLFLALVASAQTAEQLEPLPNVDFNILAGNSLTGILQVNADSFDQLAKGAQGSLLSGLSAANYEKILADKNESIAKYKQHADVPGAAQGLDQDIRLLQLREHIDKIRRDSYAKLNQMLLGDFADLGIRCEQATWDETKHKPGKPVKRNLAIADIEALHPFHWGFEFDEVMNRNGGFDAIITNPPWENFKPDAKEFFAEFSDVVTKNKMTIKDFEKEQVNLLQRADVRAAWLGYRSRFPHVNLYFRNSSQYKNQTPNVAIGKRPSIDLNLYKLFIEQCFNLLRDGGECGIVAPSGIYTDLGAKQLREMLFTQSEVTGLFCFENRKEIFEGVHRSFKFVVLTFRKNGPTRSFPASFMRHEVAELERFPKHGAIEIPLDLIKRLSPESLSVMEFRNATDIQVAKRMTEFPPLGETISDAWNITFRREFHMTDDSHLYQTMPGPEKLPLCEGKMIHQFNHAWGKPQYWLDEKEAAGVLLTTRRRAAKQTAKRHEITWGEDEEILLDYQSYRLAFRDVAASTNERTMIATVLPPRRFCPHTMSLESVYLIRAEDGKLNPNYQSMNPTTRLYLCAVLNSFVVDSWLRRSVTNHLSFFFVYGVPVPRLTKQDAAFAPIVARAARLICTAPEFDELARAVGLPDHTAGATNAVERARLRAELDGLIAHLYSLTEAEFTYILTTFPLVSETVKVAAQNAYRDVARGLLT